MYSELSDAGLGLVLALTGFFPFVNTNTVIELVGNAPQNYLLFATCLVFTRLPLEILASTKHSLYGEGTALLAGNKLTETCLLHCIFGIILATLLYPIYSLYGKAIYSAINPLTPAILILVVALFLYKQKNRVDNLVIMALSGTMGLIVLGKNLASPWFILLTGLYALPELISAERIEENETSSTPWLSIFIGAMVGMTSSLLPAMTPAVLSVIALSLMPGSNQNGTFAAMNSTILGSRLVSDFAAAEFISKGRSGTTAKLLEVTNVNFSTIYVYLVLGIVLAVLGYKLALWVNKRSITAQSTPFKIIAAVLLLGYGTYLNGTSGLIVMVACALIGITAKTLGANRASLGSAVLLPAFASHL